MVGGNSSKRVRLNFNECIPDEVLFEILVRLSAKDIYFGARLVCQKWYHIHMTRSKYFIDKHLAHASYGLMYRDGSGNVVFTYAREDRGGIDTCKLDYYSNIRLPGWRSCNGLTLECVRYFKVRELIYYVTNISTNQVFRLPPCSYVVSYSRLSAIGYDAASVTYKVVVLHVHGCDILTVGVDKSWRTVRTDHLSDLGKKILMRSYPIITEGFVHWHGFFGTEVVTLNLETEIIRETPPPVNPEVEKITRSYFLSTGRYLSLFLQPGKLAREVFELKPETGEWRKLANFCLEGQKEWV